MAGITLANAEAKLAEWLEADSKVASSQYYMIDGKQLTRANAAEIRQNIEFWDRQVKRLSRGGLKIQRGVPVG